MWRKRFRRRRFRRGRRARKTFRRKGRNKESGFMGNPVAALTVNKGLGIPDRLRTKVRYCELTTSISSVTGAIGKLVFSCNGLYDPDFTNAGHQPMYFDQLMILYKNYKVIGSKMQARVTYTSGAPAESLVTLYAANSTSTSAFTDVGNAIEQGHIRKFILAGATDNTGNQHDSVLKENFSLRKWAADRRFDSDCSGTSAANPQLEFYYVLLIQPLDLASNVTLTCTVCIDYIADFYNPNTMIQS